MSTYNLFLACRHSETVEQHGGKFYLQSTTKMAFTVASDYCKSKFMTLATMRDQESFDNVLSFLGNRPKQLNSKD